MTDVTSDQTTYFIITAIAPGNLLFAYAFTYLQCFLSLKVKRDAEILLQSTETWYESTVRTYPLNNSLSHEYNILTHFFILSNSRVEGRVKEWHSSRNNAPKERNKISCSRTRSIFGESDDDLVGIQIIIEFFFCFFLLVHVDLYFYSCFRFGFIFSYVVCLCRFYFITFQMPVLCTDGIIVPHTYVRSLARDRWGMDSA